MSKFILKSLCEKCLVLLVIITLAISVSGKPHPRKTCGRDLVERVNRICQSRGGHLTYTAIRANRRVRRGIVNECCAQICADQDLHPYCSNAEDENAVPSSFEISVDNEMPENRMPEAQALTRGSYLDTKPVIVSIIDGTTVTPEEVTTEISLERNIKSPHFQVGTVPPEYRISPFVPSHSRLMN